MMLCVLKTYGKCGGVMIDVGANIGNHSIYFTYRNIFRQIIAYEAIESTYKILTTNVKINRFTTKIDCRNKGVGSHNGYALINKMDDNNIGGTSITHGNGDIEVITLDYEMIEDVSFLKVDVEGFECEVIKGALQTIERYNPVLMVEIHEADTMNTEYIINLLNDRGYQYMRLDEINYLFFK